jgi:hypothetical protein
MAIDQYYGDSMSGKSQAIERLIRYLIKTTGKKARIYIGDGGAETYNSHGLVDDGMIEIMDFSGRSHPMTLLKLMVDHYFLKDPKDPTSKLVPPPDDFFDIYGLVVYEGGAVIGNWLLSDVPGGLAWHSSKETGFGGVKDDNDELHYDDVSDEVKGYGEDYTAQGVNSPKHFYIAQRKLLSAIRASKKFPGHTIWTTHPVEAPDKTEGGASDKYGKVTGKKIIGPDYAGKAMASLIGKEFGATLHFDTVTLTEKEKDETSKKQITTLEREYRIYTRRHYDPNNVVMVEYLAGNRCAVPSMMPDHITSKEPGDAILQFYQIMSNARKAAKEQKA